MSLSNAIDRHAFALAALITVLGLALRLDGFFDLWINSDEGIYNSIARAPFAQARAELAGNAYPPLYPYLLRGLAALSDGPSLLRLPALLCGTGAIFAMFVLGRRVQDSVAGLIAAALLALSPGAVMQSQIMRPYMAQLLLVTVALAGLVGWLQNGRRRSLAAYSAALVASLTVHYATFVVVGGLGLWFTIATVTRRFTRRQLTELAVAHVPIALVTAYLYVFHIRPMMGSGIQSQAQTGWLRQQFADNAGDLWRSFVGVFEYTIGPHVSGIAALAFLASLAIAIARRRPLLPGLAAATLAVAVTLAALALYPLGATRHSIYLAAVLLPVLATGAAIALRAGWRGSLPVVAVLLAAALLRGPVDRLVGVPEVRPPIHPELFVRVTEIDALRPHLDRVLAEPGALILDTNTYYLLGPLFDDAHRKQNSIGPVRHFRWRERHVLVSPAWSMPGGPTGITDNTHLAWLLTHVPRPRPRFTEILRGDVRVLVASIVPGGAARLPNAIDAVCRLTGRDAALSELLPESNLCLFRLDTTRYLAAIAALPGH